MNLIKIRQLIKSIPLVKRILILYHLKTRKNSFLIQSGWFKSTYRRRTIDRELNPLPWLTYSAIYFISDRIKRNFNIFEFGGGNSTLWWGQRVGKVVSNEHDLDWFLEYKDLVTENVNLLYNPLDESDVYEKAPLSFNLKFDIIVIDGRKRVECAFHVIEALSKSGVIIWDNSERARYKVGKDFLVEKGFKQLDFYGMGPVALSSWCTSIFYRVNNCLDI